ncbi:hypothetical protein ACK31H_16875, partial [Aeromonas caviae]
EGKLMTHDEPCSMAPDDKHDLISGTCSHLPYLLGRIERGVTMFCVGIILTPSATTSPSARYANAIKTS